LTYPSDLGIVVLCRLVGTDPHVPIWSNAITWQPAQYAVNYPLDRSLVLPTLTRSDHLSSLQLRILSINLLQDGYVGVGVFPESEEILISGLGFRNVVLHGIGSG
jgi:hypothetical protein